MQRRALLVAAVAVAAVLAFGVGAATLDGALEQGVALPSGDADLTDSGGKQSAGTGSAGPDCGDCGSAFLPSITLAGALPTIPGIAVVGLAGVGAAVLVLVWFRAGGGTSAALADVARRTDGVETAADGTSTTIATVDDPPADNPVYRGWHGMVDRLDATGEDDRNRATTTPGEYASAARERGWDGDAVDTLTALFQRVRYGDATVTDDRADRARRATVALSDDES